MVTQTTDRECHNCGEMYVYMDGELVCMSCHFAPDAPIRRKDIDEWERFWTQRATAVEGGDRKRMVGGYAHAYL